jgi:hypothetical protein
VRVCQIKKLQMRKWGKGTEVIEDDCLFVLVLVKTIFATGGLVNGQTRPDGVQRL